MGASFEVEAINSKENAFEKQESSGLYISQIFLKYAIFVPFCFAFLWSHAGRVLLKNLLPENQPGAEQELLQHVLWIENCSADAQTKQTRNMFGILVYRADPQPNANEAHSF